MLRILVYTAEAQGYLPSLQSVAPRATFAVASTPAEAFAHLGDTEVLFAWGIPRQLVREMPELRWVQWLGAGVDKVIDAVPRDVVLTRVVGAFSAVMAEHVFAFLLAIRRDLFTLHRQQQERRWRRVPGTLLRGQRLGVAGLGSIGREIVALGRAFGMECWGLSRGEQMRDAVDRHFLPGEIAEFASGVHNLVSVLPATPQTDGLFSAEVFAAMRPDSIFVNIGRGNAVDEEALAVALQRGCPAHAQLDVFREEPLPDSSPLWALANCHISSHCSGPSEPQRVSAFAAENLRRYLAGEPLQGVVDRGRGY